MIRKGYENGLVRIVDGNPLGGDGTVCKIGDGWFYFGGMTAENMTAEEYIASVPTEDILREIYETLEEFRKIGDVFEDEYLYYQLILSGK